MTDLIDKFGRHVKYVRLSVTDRCDFRCVYCMAEEMQFMPRDQILSLEEIAQLGQAFIELGVEKIRITGGEPLVRRNIISLFERLGALPGLRELALTSNGSQLPKYATALRAAGVSNINISLDSLRPDRFRRITRTGELDNVINGIDAARAAGFKRIKINCVIMRGGNDDEILDLVRFAVDREIDISFIEEMPLGVIESHDRALSHMPSADIRDIIQKHYPLSDSDWSSGGPSRYCDIQGTSSKVGFISPHSHNFCHLCNRVRVTAEGRLLLCLGNEHSADLRSILRSPNSTLENLKHAISQAMDLKPERHHFDLEDTPQIVRFMNMTGG